MIVGVGLKRRFVWLWLLAVTAVLPLRAAQTLPSMHPALIGRSGFALPSHAGEADATSAPRPSLSLHSLYPVLSNRTFIECTAAPCSHALRQTRLEAPDSSWARRPAEYFQGPAVFIFSANRQRAP